MGLNHGFRSTSWGKCYTGWWYTYPSEKYEFVNGVGMTFHFHVLQGSPCSDLHFGLALLCTEDASAVVIRLNNVILHKIVRYQVSKLSRKLLSGRHFKGSLYKICYRLCNGQVEAMGVDFAPCRFESSILLLPCQRLVGWCSMAASPHAPCSQDRLSQARQAQMEYRSRLLARHPKMHWSKLVMPIASRVRRRRMAELVQTLDGSSAFAHVGYWGCSMKAQPPVKAKTSTTSMMNRMSLDPMRTCRHAFNGMLGIPFGQLPDLTGGGPPCKSPGSWIGLAGGPPPAPHTCPVLMRSIHQVSEDEEAKSPLSLCRHMSTESTNSWWPWGKIWCSNRSWRSPLLR